MKKLVFKTLALSLILAAGLSSVSSATSAPKAKVKVPTNAASCSNDQTPCGTTCCDSSTQTCGDGTCHDNKSVTKGVDLKKIIKK